MDNEMFENKKMIVKIYVNTSCPGKLFYEFENETTGEKNKEEFDSNLKNFSSIMARMYLLFKPLLMFDEIARNFADRLGFDLDEIVQKNRSNQEHFDVEKFIEDLKKDIDKK